MLANENGWSHRKDCLVWRRRRRKREVAADTERGIFDGDEGRYEGGRGGAFGSESESESGSGSDVNDLSGIENGSDGSGGMRTYRGEQE